MQTDFSPHQLADPATAVAAAAIRKCVHCGFCMATCPTYLLLGDELDGPRGRIYLMKDMLENERVPTAAVVRHIDRCLSCLSCMTACPSDVNYMHLVDHARAYIEDRYRRPWAERLTRAMLAAVLPYPRRLRIALRFARLLRPAASWADRSVALQPIAAMLRLAPQRASASTAETAEVARTDSRRAAPRGRVLVLRGCVEPVLAPRIRSATLRLLERLGYAVCEAQDEGCCGALVHHLGRHAQALAAARRNVDAWYPLLEQGLSAIIMTTSGCGTTVKNYGFMLRNDAAYAERAARVSALARDISELLQESDLPTVRLQTSVSVAWHAPCSLQHGQRVTDAPQRLLRAAGFEVRTPQDSHLCCGSAGTFNLLQPKLAAQLGERKAANLRRLDTQVVASSNIGCAMQIARHGNLPVVHLVELLDWATGGSAPVSLAQLDQSEAQRQ